MENTKKRVCYYNLYKDKVEECDRMANLTYTDEDLNPLAIVYAEDVDMEMAEHLADAIGSMYCTGGYVRFDDNSIKCSNGENTWDYATVLEFLADWYGTIAWTYMEEMEVNESNLTWNYEELEFVQKACFGGIVPRID